MIPPGHRKQLVGATNRMGTCPLLSEVEAAIPPSSQTLPARPQRALTIARSDWRSDCVVATTAEGS